LEAAGVLIQKIQSKHTSAVADPGGEIGAIAPPKTYESNFVRHDFEKFGKQHSRYQGHFVVHCFVTKVL